MNLVQNKHRIDQTTRKYISERFYALNTLLLFYHIFFLCFFKYYNISIMYLFNYVSIAYYVFAGYSLIKGSKTEEYADCTIFEITIHMILAVYCVGWSYGFQLYSFGMIPIVMFADFYTNKKMTVNRLTLYSIITLGATFIVLRTWTYNMDPIYTIDNTPLIQDIYYINAASTLFFSVSVSYLYGYTVLNLEQTLQYVAYHDPLTGLLNRSQIRTYMFETMKSCNINENLMYVALMDIDNFKQVNDTYGHDVGDIVLKEFAQTLEDMETHISHFIPSRWGGEEFLVIYTECSEHEKTFTEYMEEFRIQIADKTITIDDLSLKISVTIGIARYDGSQTPDDLVKSADGRLYLGKTQGKNRVIY